jgi:hypothetical protein
VNGRSDVSVSAFHEAAREYASVRGGTDVQRARMFFDSIYIGMPVLTVLWGHYSAFVRLMKS